MTIREYKEAFLDPSGANYEEFVDETQKALRLLGIWWASPNANPSPSERGEIIGQIEAKLKKEPFSPTYRELERCVKELSASVRFNGNNFVNIHPMGNLPSIIASLLVSLQNPNNIVPDVSPATTRMEVECVDWLGKLVGFKDSEASGNIVTDGTIANLTAILAARDKIYGEMGSPRDTTMREAGLYQQKPGIVIATKSSHYSLRKSLWILGLGDENVVKLPVAIDQEMVDRGDYTKQEAEELQKFYAGEQEPFSLLPRGDELKQALESANRNDVPVIAVVPTIGTTETGTMEPIITKKYNLAKMKTRYGFFLHSDAAIGGLALTIPDLKKSALGIQQSDSVAVDFHKWGYVQYPCGAIIFRERKLHQIIGHEAPYLEHLAQTIEGSRPGSPSAAALVAIRTFEVDGYREIISSLIRSARTLVSKLSAEGFQVLHEVHLNTVCFSIRKEGESREQINQWNEALEKRINKEGRFFVNKTDELSGIKVRNWPRRRDSKLVDIEALRMLVMNPYTTDRNIDRFIEDLKYYRRKFVW